MKIKHLLFAGALAAAVSIVGGAYAGSAAYPSYYPADYSKLVDASRKEQGLVVYSNMGDNNWKPVLEGFNKTYPWIKVETLDLGSGTVHSRWEAESGSNSRTADLLISGANDRWAAYGLEGKMLDYRSPEFAHVESFAKPFAGVSVLSTDPLVIVYNAKLLPQGKRPTGFSSWSDLAAADPATFKGRLTTYDASRSAFGLAAWWYVMRAKGDTGWEKLRQIGPMIRGETSGGAMNEKITSGEYVAGFNISGITIFPRLEKAGGDILGFAFPDDGTPLMLRGMGIPKTAANPNSAKLFFDYLLSKEGQTLLGKGGLVPHRSDVAESDVRYTYKKIVATVGEKNIIRVGFDKALIDEAKPFAAKFAAYTAK